MRTGSIGSCWKGLAAPNPSLLPQHTSKQCPPPSQSSPPAFWIHMYSAVWKHRVVFFFLSRFSPPSLFQFWSKDRNLSKKNTRAAFLQEEHEGAIRELQRGAFGRWRWRTEVTLPSGSKKALSAVSVGVFLLSPFSRKKLPGPRSSGKRRRLALGGSRLWWQRSGRSGGAGGSSSPDSRMRFAFTVVAGKCHLKLRQLGKDR